MMDLIKKNKVILIVVLVVIAGFAWFGLADRTPTSSTSLITSETGDGGGTVQDQQIVRLLLDMRSIRLDGSIFENPAFNSLRDFGREIVPEPVGRSNPFAPTAPAAPTQEDQEADAIFAQ